jgi:hypothetical protein
LETFLFSKKYTSIYNSKDVSLHKVSINFDSTKKYRETERDPSDFLNAPVIHSLKKTAIVRLRPLPPAISGGLSWLASLPPILSFVFFFPACSWL